MKIESPETNAWDITFYHEDGREAGGAMTYDDEVWTDFLNDHLARYEQGNFFIDTTGAKAPAWTDAADAEMILILAAFA